jgi:hypothetical protein
MERSLRWDYGSGVYNCCWPSPAQSFPTPSPVGLASIFYSRRTSPYKVSRVSMEYVCCLSVSMETFVESSLTRNCLPNRCPAMDYSASICCSGNVCLESCWLAMNFLSGSTFPVFRRHVTISLHLINNFYEIFLVNFDVNYLNIGPDVCSTKLGFFCSDVTWFEFRMCFWSRTDSRYLQVLEFQLSASCSINAGISCRNIGRNRCTVYISQMFLHVLFMSSAYLYASPNACPLFFSKFTRTVTY